MSDWKWWASFDGGERYSVGPEDSRDGVIAAATAECEGRPFEILEATQEPVRMSRYIDVERMVECADEDAYEDHGDPGGSDPIFDFPVGGEAALDLEDRIKRAVDEWQDAHGIAPTSWAFTETRNHETITPAVEPEATP